MEDAASSIAGGAISTRSWSRSTACSSMEWEYLYFIDEIFLPNRALLEALVQREVAFGMQTRINLWTPGMIELLGRAGWSRSKPGWRAWRRRGAMLSTRTAGSTPPS